MKTDLNQTVNTNYFTTRKYPAYGLKLEKMRRNGKVPAKRIIAATQWNIGKLFPRIIVPSDTPVSSLRFEYLTGLHVQIVYFDSDNHIESLIHEIRSIQPATLTSFNMDAVKRGEPAFKMIFSQSVMEKAA